MDCIVCVNDDQLFLLSSDMFPSEESSEALTFSCEWGSAPRDPFLLDSAPGGKPWSASSRVGLSYDEEIVKHGE